MALYASPGSSRTATSHMVPHTMARPSTFSLVESPNLSLGNHLLRLDVFVILCRLCLAGTTVSFSANALQVPTIAEFNFFRMIHAHVPHYFM